MLFNSLQFAIFFPVAALVYFIIPKKTRCLWLLLASYVFYMSASPKYVVFLLFSTLVTFAGALLVERAEPKKKKLYMWLTFLCSLGVLGFLKYFDFLLGNVNTVLGMAGIGSVNKPFSIGLPVGISFYTFQSLGYMVDVCRGDTKAERNILNYALFVSFFPVIL